MFDDVFEDTPWHLKEQSAQAMAELVNASLPLAVAFTALAALASTSVVLLALVRVHRLQSRSERAPAPAGESPPATTKPHFRPWINIAISIGWVGVSICLIGLLTGHVALSGSIALQILWAGAVLATLYLGMRFIDDLVCALLGAKGVAGRRINDRFGLDPRHVERIAVVASALLRTLLVLLGLIALAMPYGASGEGLVERALGLARGITIGQLVLSPANVVRAIGVFLLATGAFHLVKRWLARRYLNAAARRFRRHLGALAYGLPASTARRTHEQSVADRRPEDPGQAA